MRLKAAQGLGEAGRQYGGASVEQVKKNLIGVNTRLKDIPASTIFARTYVATADTLTTAANRSVTSKNHAVVQQIAGGSGIQIDDDRGMFHDQPTVENAGSKYTTLKQSSLFSEGKKVTVIERGESSNTKAAVALNALANFGDLVNEQSAAEASQVLQGEKQAARVATNNTALFDPVEKTQQPL